MGRLFNASLNNRKSLISDLAINPQSGEPQPISDNPHNQ